MINDYSGVSLFVVVVFILHSLVAIEISLGRYKIRTRVNDFIEKQTADDVFIASSHNTCTRYKKFIIIMYFNVNYRQF